MESCTDPQKKMCCPSTKTAITVTLSDLTDTRESRFQQTEDCIILGTLLEWLAISWLNTFFFNVTSM
ncbi:hypothetical protein XELAEV_18031772mg [Xenopus laevis]|uniref:Uncharacterized protein n=1 Tax=Xenopus laevis TaxID=8355 RepID=A0A974CND7_XENLA|nr:hypothetical protein XELAEV_18031772mg [Xenopus laevis]